jgi:alpha-ketoglutarate-dependent taurine dioxygenase
MQWCDQTRCFVAGEAYLDEKLAAYFCQSNRWGLGCRGRGVHLGHLNDAVLAEVRAAFLEHQVLFFRHQEITRDPQKAFARRFGTLQIHPFEQPLKDQGHPEFVVFGSDDKYPYVAASVAQRRDLPRKALAWIGFALRSRASVWR